MDKTLADLLDDIPDDALDWLRHYQPPAEPLDWLRHYQPPAEPLTRSTKILAAVKRHLPDPPYVPAVGDWVTVKDPASEKDVTALVVHRSDRYVWLSNGVHEPTCWHATAHTFRPAERPEGAS